jgi:hypothetical protein
MRLNVRDLQTYFPKPSFLYVYLLCPWKMFLSCVGDLANLFFLSFPAMIWGVESFTLAALLRCDQVEFLRYVDGSKMVERSPSGQILGRSVSALPDFSGFYSDCGLLIKVCGLPFMLI